MVKFGLLVFYHFGLMVKNSAFQFSYDSAFRIRPNGPVRFCVILETLVDLWSAIPCNVIIACWNGSHAFPLQRGMVFTK